MPITISEFTEDSVRYLLFTTPEGTSYRFKRDERFGQSWEGAFNAGAHHVIVQPPPGQSVMLSIGVALSWNGDPVNAEWFIRAPNGTYRSLGASNIAVGSTAGAIYFLNPAINPAGYTTYTAEMVHDGGALCVTVSDACGVYVAGWVI